MAAQAASAVVALAERHGQRVVHAVVCRVRTVCVACDVQ